MYQPTSSKLLIHGEPDGVPQDQRRLRQLILLRRPPSTTSTTNWRRRSKSCAAPVIKSIHKSELDWWSMNSSPDCERENRSTAPCKMTSACKDHARSTTCKMIIGTGLHRRLDGSPSSTSTTLHSLPPWLHSPTAWPIAASPDWIRSSIPVSAIRLVGANAQELRSAPRAHVHASQLRMSRILARACARMYLSCSRHSSLSHQGRKRAVKLSSESRRAASRRAVERAAPSHKRATSSHLSNIATRRLHPPVVNKAKYYF